jgi:hypothetical protein
VVAFRPSKGTLKSRDRRPHILGQISGQRFGLVDVPTQNKKCNAPSIMELAIAASIAGLGYYFNSTQDAKKPTPMKPTSLSSTQNARVATTLDQSNPEKSLLSEARQMEERAAEKKWTQAQDPQNTNVIANQRLYPFFKSARTQNLNESILDRKRDLFMGNESTYVKKEEATARFKTLPQQIDSSGSQGNAQCPRRMPVASMLQNNVLPAEQIRVGPGVGLPVDELAGNDGFHPRLRVLPSNANVYRRNQLQGRIKAGKPLNGVRAADPVVRNNNPPAVWDMSRYPLQKGKATVNALKQRPNASPECVNRYHEQDYAGVAHMPSGHAIETSQNTRIRDDDNMGFDQTNITAASTTGTGGYSHYMYDDSKIASQQREQHNHNITGVSGPLAPNAPTGAILSSKTLRESGGERFGIAGHYTEAGFTRPNMHAKPTLREQTGGQTATGAAISAVKAHTQQCTYKQLGKEAKRPLVDGYWANPERTEALKRTMVGPENLTSVCVGRTAYRVRDRSQVENNVATGHAVMHYNNIAPVGRSTNSHNRLPETNIRSDFGLLDAQMQSNPYAAR